MKKWAFILLYYISSVSAAPTITQEQLQSFDNEIKTNAEKYFHVKIESEKLESFLKEQRMIYYQNLAICQPGTYRYGYIDLFPIFVTATISGFQHDKCIEESIHTAGVTLPDAAVLVVKCQFQRYSLAVFNNPNSENMIHEILKKECLATMNGKPINP